MTTFGQFINLVADMRRAQMDYVSSGDESFLLLAKALARRVDKVVADYKQPAQSQMDLYDMESEAPSC